MSAFADTLISVWQHHKKNTDLGLQHDNEDVFWLELIQDARTLFGDVASELDWKVWSHQGSFRACTSIEDTNTGLMYGPNETGTHKFTAFQVFGEKEPSRVLDNRLLLGVLLTKEGWK